MSTALIVVIVVAATAGLVWLPMRKQWNADGSHDRARLEPEEDE